MSKGTFKAMILANQKMYGINSKTAHMKDVEVENKEENNKNKNRKRKAINFMAFGKTSTVNAVSTFDFWKGISNFKVLAVNPTKAKAEEILGRTIDKDIVYVDTDNNGNQRIRIDFFLEATEYEGDIVPPIFRHSIFVTKSFHHSQGDKWEIIDRYGRGAWAFQSEIDAKTTEFQKKDGGKYKANIAADYKKAMIGEVALMEFIKNFLLIPDVQRMNPDTKEWYMIENPSDAECMFEADDWKKMFNGDFSPIQDIMATQPDNLIKLCVGIRTNDEGKQFITTLATTMKANSKNMKKIEDAIRDINAREINNGRPVTRYSTNTLAIEKFEPTNMEEVVNNMPVDDNDELPF